MYIRSKAIVLSSIKYGDASLIVKCLTVNGIHSFLIKNIRSSKRTKFSIAYFQKLAQLSIVFSHKNNGSLGYIKEVSIVYNYQFLHNDFRKSTISFYLSELFSKVIKEGEQDSETLLEYISTSLQWLDAHPFAPNFHLIITLELTRYLGFYPTNNYSSQNPYFDFKEGMFVAENPEVIIPKELETAFIELFNMSYDNKNPKGWTGDLRNKLLQTLLKYYKLHITDFGEIKSLKVLSTLFE